MTRSPVHLPRLLYNHIIINLIYYRTFRAVCNKWPRFFFFSGLTANPLSLLAAILKAHGAQ